MNKSNVKKYFPVWLQNVFFSLVIALSTSIAYDFLSHLKISESSSVTDQSIDINFNGLIGNILIEIGIFWLILFVFLSFLRSIYSILAEIKLNNID